MSEELTVTGSNREEKYRSLLPQVRALAAGEPDAVARMANICAALKYGMGYFWAGFYLVKGGELVLGPFQGPVACTRIARGRGVCGRCWESGETVIVEDVRLFPGHIACNPASRSEIVVPLKDREGRVAGVLDVDQDVAGAFDGVDRKYLEEVAAVATLGGEGIEP